MNKPMQGEQVIGLDGIAMATITRVIGWNPAYQAFIVKTTIGQLSIVPDGCGAWKEVDLKNAANPILTRK